MKILFLAVSSILWLTTAGYVLIIYIATRFKKPDPIPSSELPEIAVVVPTLNEEQFVNSKCEDLENIDYPSDRVHLVFIDCGSTDQTIARIEEQIKINRRIQLIRIERVRNKIEQVTQSLKLLKQDFIVFTDADTQLEPACVKHLIELLMVDHQTAIAGALVFPMSPLLEERIHWTLLNHLWWMEGEALSSAGFSGVCYAVRRDSVKWLDHKMEAEDIHLSLTACAYGHRVRLVPSAIASELRVPATNQDFLQFRRRRGSRYFSALRQFNSGRGSPFAWKFVRAIRLWQIGITPWLAMLWTALAVFLCATADWLYAVVGFSFFLLFMICIMRFLQNKIGNTCRWNDLLSGSIKYAILLLISLLTLRNPAATANRI